MLVRLCPSCGCQLPYPGRGKCPDCARTYERERSRRRRATSAAVKVRDSKAWKEVREAAKRRDGYRCRRCGSSEKVEAHHVHGLADGGSAFTLANVLTLCAVCHRREGGQFLTQAHPPAIQTHGERKSESRGINVG